MSVKPWLSCLIGLFGLLFSPSVWSASASALTNTIGMEFVLIPAGSFIMGVPKGPAEQDPETPQHPVTISKPFYLGKYEVTQKQWEVVMGSNPSKFKDPSRPVENVSWKDVQEFIQRLNEREKVQRYRLPTEAEWEYAARAGTTTRYSWGDDESVVGVYAWYNNNSEQQTHPVGEKQPNLWGLYDMAGNVWEWVQDWYHDEYYAQAPEVDPPGPAKGSNRVVRGGGWYRFRGSMRPATRDFNSPGRQAADQGFRLVRTLP
ncbi:MAG: formylglycine-generating enzyme family protein [Magnetococcales bacterium]|nr:formylglycine-generating enzyme family protein [Magnetococcales bacterium]